MIITDKGICRLINKKKTKDFPTPKYGGVNGRILGYTESDEHFRKRILKLTGYAECKKI